MSGSSNTHGGKRIGAGRKPGHRAEASTVIRVPLSAADNVKNFVDVLKQKRIQQTIDPVSEFSYPALEPSELALPLFSSKVTAGLPSAADDHIEKRLDPNGFLIDDQDATFFVTIQGYSMMDTGLLPGDKAVIDRSKVAKMGDIVLAMVNGEFTIKQLGKTKAGNPRLLPANSSGQFLPIEITEDMQFEIWGVVTGSFRRFR
jgi:DNA polymerase V